jgi:Flp pilus assembly protein TadD
MQYVFWAVAIVITVSVVGISTPGFSKNSDFSVADRRTQYEAQLEEYQNDLTTLLKLAALEGEAGNESEMVQYLNRAMLAHPQELSPRIVLGRYYLVNKSPDRVETLFAGVWEVTKSNSDALSVLVAAQFGSGNYENARVSLEELAKLEPGKPAVFYLQARVYGELQEEKLAEQALRRTVELDPFHFPARLALARLLLMKGETGAARKHAELLQAQAGDHPDVIQLVDKLNGVDHAPG